MAKDLGARLVQAGLASRQQLAEALADAPTSTAPLAARLAERGVSEDDIVGLFLADGFGPLQDGDDLARAPNELRALLPGEMAHLFLALPLRESPAGLVVAMADPTDRHALRELEHVLGRGILPTVARVSDLRGALEQAYPGVAPRPPSVTPLQLVRRKDEDLSASSPRERAPTNPEGDEVVLPLVRTKAFPTPAGGAPRPAPPKPAGAPVQKTFKRPKASEPPPPPSPSPPPRAPGTADYVRPPDAPEEPATSTGRRSIIPPHEASWGDLVPPPSSSAPPRAASSPAPASAHELGATLAAIRASQDRDGIVRHACEGALTVARSAVFLAVRKGVLRGWDGLGAGVSADAIRNLWIPTTSPSMFQRVVDEAEPHVGRFGSSAADNLYRAATGSRGGHVVLQPVVVGGRVVGVLCADDARGATAPERIETLAHAVSDAFKALIVRKKR